jgi:hypothetical protein
MPIVIRPRGTPKPVTPTVKKPVVLPTRTLGAAAFAGTNLGKLNIPSTPGDISPIIRTVALPEAQMSGAVTTLDECLAKYPLPLTPMGDVFTLHGWQREDITALAAWTRVGAFLPVGAGKTVVATLVALIWDDEVRVVAVQPILVKQWVRWLNSIPGTGGAVAYKGTPKQRNALELDKARWWVMSYGIFKNDFDKLCKLTRHKKVALIVDEAQNIKNTETDLFKKCNTFSLGQKLCLMTGTELNSPADAYGYIKIKTPGVYRSYGQFENIHAAKRDFFKKVIEWQNLPLMNQNLYMQSVQRTKEQVHAHLPKANYIPFEYELDPKHKKLYDQLVEEQLLELESGGKIDGTTVNSLYLFCQQVILNWARFSGDDSVKPAGFELLDTLIDTTNFGAVDKDGVPKGPNKFIVWTWFKDSTRLTGDYLESLYPGRVVLAYSDSNSQKSVDRFMEDPNCAWLVAQPLSAGAGLNPQYVCYNSVFLEFPTRTILFRQSAGRIDREGQRFNANIWIGIAEGTIQNKMYNNLLSNDELVQTVQGSGRDLRKIIHGL